MVFNKINIKKAEKQSRNEMDSALVVLPGIEPGTQGFSVLCSTN